MTGDDDADNQSEIIAVTSTTSISLTVSAPLYPCNQAVSPAFELTITSPAVKPRYCCNGRLPDGYHLADQS